MNLLNLNEFHIHLSQNELMMCPIFFNCRYTNAYYFINATRNKHKILSKSNKKVSRQSIAVDPPV